MIRRVTGIYEGPTGSVFREELSENDLNELAQTVIPSHFDPWMLMDEAVELMMIPPMPDPFAPEDDPFTIKMSAFDVADPRAVLMAEEIITTPRQDYEIDWDQLERTPELIKPQFTFHTWHFIAGYFPMSFQNHELAKFIVHRNEVGVVFDIQTGLNMMYEGVSEIPASPNWRWPRGDPFYYTRPELYPSVEYPPPEIMWHLRIERVDPEGVDPNQWRTFPANFLPGTPYHILPQWDEMMFMYGENHKVHFVIPENSVLSLWIQRLSEGDETPIRDVSGILQGFTQPQGSCRTYKSLTSYGV